MIHSTVYRYIVLSLLFVFFGFTNIVPHVGSTVLVLLTLAGLPFCFSHRSRSLASTKGEKWIFIAIVTFVVIYVGSFTITNIVQNNPDPDYSSIDHRLRLLAFIPILFLFRNLRLKQGAFWAAICVGATLTGLFSIYMSWRLPPNVRITGSYHAIAFGDLAIVLAFISLLSVNYFHSRRRWLVGVPIVAFLLSIMASLLSGTKGAWIAVPAFLLILIFHNRFRGALILIFVIIAILIVYQKPDNMIDDRIQATLTEWNDYQNDIRVFRSSLGTRLEMWKASAILFKEHPITGVGVTNYRSAKKRLIEEGKVSRAIKRFGSPHNVFLNMLTQCGIFGLAAIMAVFIAPLFVLLGRAKQSGLGRDIAYAGLIHVVGFIHFAMTESLFSRNVFVSFFVILLAIVLALSDDQPEAHLTKV